MTLMQEQLDILNHVVVDGQERHQVSVERNHVGANGLMIENH